MALQTTDFSFHATPNCTPTLKTIFTNNHAAEKLSLNQLLSLILVTVSCQSVKRMVTNILGRTWIKSGRDLFEELLRYFPGAAVENCRSLKPQQQKTLPRI
jgi:hypothetical protein